MSFARSSSIRIFPKVNANYAEHSVDPAMPAPALSADALHFLAWCCGIQKTIGMPDGCYKEAIAEPLWQQIASHSDSLRSQIHLRSKSALLDWADLLYRMHWAYATPSLASRNRAA
jgi:hypothetical protein